MIVSASLKMEVNEKDKDKLISFLGDWSKLRNVASNNILKKAEYDKWVTKVNTIDSIHFQNSIQ